MNLDTIGPKRIESSAIGSSAHNGTVTILFADGHTEQLSPDTDPKVLEAMLRHQ